MSNCYPERITSLTQWVVADADKIPLDPKSRRRADTTNPATWADYVTACRVATQHGLSVGFVFTTGSGIVGIDLDKCRNPETGVLELWALAIVQSLNTLTEISFSGTGLHILVEGELPEGGRKKGHIEMYDSGRHFLMTGNILPGYDTLRSRPVAIRRLHEEVFAQPEPAPASRPPAPSTPIDRDGETILALVEKTAKGRHLLSGDMSSYPSQSEADQALCNLFVAAGASRRQADDLFRRSGLWRDKWDQRRGEKTYGEKTLDRAFDGSVTPWSTSTPIVPVQPIRAASDDVCADCDTAPCAELQRENLRLRAELDQKTAELAEVKEQNTLLIATVCNPNLDGLGVAALRTVIHVAHERRMGRARPDGSVKATARKVGDDQRPFDEHAPILPASTTYAQVKRLEKFGLIERTVEPSPVRVPRQTKGAGNSWQPVRDEAGNIEYVDAVTDVTFVNIDGTTINDLIRPLAFFAPPPTDDASPGAHTPKRGGDRRSTTFRALKAALESAPPCPHCGDDALTVVCTSCGCITSPEDLATAAEAETPVFMFETGGDQTGTDHTFARDFKHETGVASPQGKPPVRFGTLNSRGVATNPLFKFETGVDDAWFDDAPAPEEPIPGWMPGFEPSRVDRYTDVTIGGRP